MFQMPFHQWKILHFDLNFTQAKGPYDNKSTLEILLTLIPAWISNYIHY